MLADSALIEELKEMEGNKSKAYKDTRGLWTIGIGHCLTKDELTSGKIEVSSEIVRWRNGLTEDQIQNLLLQDLTLSESAVSCYVKVMLTQGQFDALVSFTFNVGINAFRNSTLRVVLNSGNYDAVPAQLRRWIHNHDGSICKGLVRRREAEVKLWES